MTLEDLRRSSQPLDVPTAHRLVASLVDDDGLPVPVKSAVVVDADEVSLSVELRTPEDLHRWRDVVDCDRAVDEGPWRVGGTAFIAVVGRVVNVPVVLAASVPVAVPDAAVVHGSTDASGSSSRRHADRPAPEGAPAPDPLLTGRVPEVAPDVAQSATFVDSDGGDVRGDFVSTEDIDLRGLYQWGPRPTSDVDLLTTMLESGSTRSPEQDCS